VLLSNVSSPKQQIHADFHNCLKEGSLASDIWEDMNHPYLIGSKNNWKPKIHRF
jgi:hypothetical protein